jgi:hypothetical protein
MTDVPFLEQLRRELTSFMAGGDFWPLWRAVMDVASHKDVPHIDQAWFDALYDLVYMAGPDPVSESDARDGIIGPNQLRNLIREKGLDAVRRLA